MAHLKLWSDDRSDPEAMVCAVPSQFSSPRRGVAWLRVAWRGAARARLPAGDDVGSHWIGSVSLARTAKTAEPENE